MGRRRRAAGAAAVGRRPSGCGRRWCVTGAGVFWEPPGMLQEPLGAPWTASAASEALRAGPLVVRATAFH